jgi:hypothetical protein
MIISERIIKSFLASSFDFSFKLSHEKNKLSLKILSLLISTVRSPN